MHSGHSTRGTLAALMGATTLLGASTTASALQFEAGGLDIGLQTSVTAGIAIRGEDINNELVAKSNVAGATNVNTSAPGAYSVNFDEGNQTYPNSGDFFFAQTKLSSDLSIRWGNWGLFARGNYRYDPVLQNETLFDDFDFANDGSRTATFADKSRREQAAEDALGDDAELFDLYLFGNFKILGRSASIRIGKQVLNWGESTFIRNGINSFIPIDARQARGPGAEVKEVFRPFGAVWSSLELSQNLSIEAFYQYDWEATIPDPAGTYFSSNDILGAGNDTPATGFGLCNEHLPEATHPSGDGCQHVSGDDGTNATIIAPNTPENGGQYGVRFNIYMPWLANTDFSLYGINYHSNLPSASVINTPTGNFEDNQFFLDYAEDIKLYGFSFNTYLQFIDTAFQAEYAFKDGQPLNIDNVELSLYASGNEPTLQGLFGPGFEFVTLDDFRGPATPNQITRGFMRFDVHQWDMSFLKRYGPNWTGADLTNILLEVAGQHVEDLPEPAELPFEGSNTEVPNQTDAATFLRIPAQDRDGYADDFAWGYRLVVANTYNNVLNRFNLTPSIRFFHDVKGNSPSPVSVFLEERKQLSIGVNGTYLNAWEAGLSYTFFWDSAETGAPPINAATQAGQRLGGQTSNLTEDRDFVNLFLRYTF